VIFSGTDLSSDGGDVRGLPAISKKIREASRGAVRQPRQHRAMFPEGEFWSGFVRLKSKTTLRGVANGRGGLFQ
jgi:hypothetical protein